MIDFEYYELQSTRENRQLRKLLLPEWPLALDNCWHVEFAGPRLEYEIVSEAQMGIDSLPKGKS